MKLHRILLAVGLAAVASQASATRYAYCAMYDLQRNSVVSGIIEIGDSPEDYSAMDRAFGAEFRDHLISLGGQPSPGGCEAKESVAEVKEQWDQNAYYLEKEGRKVIQTGWTGSRLAAAAGADGRPSGGSQSAAAVSNRAKDDAAILDAQKAAAAANAQRVAEAARNEAAMKAQMAKFLAELKKRGSAQ